MFNLNLSYLMLRNWFIRRKLLQVKKNYIACYWHNLEWAKYYDRVLIPLSQDLTFRAEVYYRAIRRINFIIEKYI